MPPKRIIELHQNTLQHILKASDNLKRCVFEDTWENICCQFFDSSIVFNSLQQEWLTLQDEDENQLTAFDFDQLDPSAYVKLVLQVMRLAKAKDALLPMNLHSAVYTFSCFAEGHVGMQVEKSQLSYKRWTRLWSGGFKKDSSNLWRTRSKACFACVENKNKRTRGFSLAHSEHKFAECRWCLSRNSVLGQRCRRHNIPKHAQTQGHEQTCALQL